MRTERTDFYDPERISEGVRKRVEELVDEGELVEVEYGEVQALQEHSLVEIEQYGGARCLRREEVTAEHATRARRGMERAREKMGSGDFNIVILDEVNVTIWFGLLAVDEVLAFLEERPPTVEVILTGRYAPAEILAKADLVTEMREVKHYFTQGVLARDGIES